MGNYNFATIRIPHSHARAPEETERLFASLELFGNLGNSYEEYCDFVAKCPSFCPVLLSNLRTGESLALLRNKGCHELTTVFRDYLVSVWRGNATERREEILQILLGLRTQPIGFEPREGEEEKVEWVLLDPTTPETLAETQRIRTKFREQERRQAERTSSKNSFPDCDPPYCDALFRMIHEPECRGYTPMWPYLITDWEHGEFIYEPANDFQRAVYRLFRENWRARSCRRCQKLFIANKHPQMFCGFECSVNARRKRDRELWKSKGSTLRRKRKQKRNGRKASK